MGKFIFYFAIAGWIISLIVNLLSNVGIDIGTIKILIWILHLGCMIVLISSILELNDNELIDDYQQSKFVNEKIPLSIIRTVLKDTPAWIKKVALAGVFYGLLNIVIALAIQTNSPQFINGQFVLKDRDQVTKIITEQDYHFYRANEIRAFSGIWIIFYGFATTLFYTYSEFTGTKEESE